MNTKINVFDLSGSFASLRDNPYINYATSEGNDALDGIAEADIFVGDLSDIDQEVLASIEKNKETIRRMLLKSSSMFFISELDGPLKGAMFDGVIPHIGRYLVGVKPLSGSYEGAKKEDDSTISMLRAKGLVKKYSGIIKLHSVGQSLFHDGSMYPKGTVPGYVRRVADCYPLLVIKSGESTALKIEYTHGKVHILTCIEEQVEIVEAYVSSFTGGLEKEPDFLVDIKIFGQVAIEESLTSIVKEIEERKIALANKRREYEELGTWKELLWQSGDRLEEIVKKFFAEYFQLNMNVYIYGEHDDEADLKGEKDGMTIIAEVKGVKGAINTKDHVSQAVRRVLDLTEQFDDKLKVVLVGNGFKDKPLCERLATGDGGMIDDRAIEFARNNGVCVVLSKDIFEIVQKSESGELTQEDRDNFLKQILATDGLWQLTDTESD